MPEPGCRLVQFQADFIFCDRDMTPGLAARVLAAAERRFGALGLTISEYKGRASVSGDWNGERRFHQFASRFVSLAGV